MRERDILVIGSGSFTHNLRRLRSPELQAAPPPDVAAFCDWMDQALTAGRVDDLLAYRTQAPYAAMQHPTDEHLLPLYVALGAGGAAARATRPSILPSPSRMAKSRWRVTRVRRTPALISCSPATTPMERSMLRSAMAASLHIAPIPKLRNRTSQQGVESMDIRHWVPQKNALLDIGASLRNGAIVGAVAGLLIMPFATSSTARAWVRSITTGDAPAVASAVSAMGSSRFT